ncbi:MAG: SiaB family protein kinase [Flavobacteriia bacterium]|jgi:hypothetical protein
MVLDVLVESQFLIFDSETTIMSLNNVYNLYRTMEEENVILSFKGIVTAELLTSLLNIMEVKMESMHEEPRVRKKVFNVLVECLQNLYHHVDEGPVPITREHLERKSAMVLIGKERNQFIIRTGNYIDRYKVEGLKERLNKINSMDKEDLKTYYQESLSSSVVSSKGTAGLGMIDIARKSGNKLEYDFLKINEETSFFCLNVKID